jgi:SnoaL-like protein
MREKLEAKKYNPIQLSNILEITQSLYRGFRYTDEKRWTERAALFADELTIDFGGVKLPQTTTPTELIAWAKLAYAKVKTQHMSFNLEVELDGDRATSTSLVHARHQRIDTDDYWHIYARLSTNIKKHTPAGKSRASK